MNRNDDSPGAALVMEHDVTSTRPHFAPTGVVESPQSVGAGNSRESRQAFRLGKILSVIVIVQHDLTVPARDFDGPLFGVFSKQTRPLGHLRAIPTDHHLSLHVLVDIELLKLVRSPR